MPGPTAPGRLTIPKSTLNSQLADRIAFGEELEGRHIGAPADLDRARDDYTVWSDFNVTLLQRAFTTDEEMRKYQNAGPFYRIDPSWNEKVKHLHEQIHDKVKSLVSLRERLVLFATDEAPRTKDVAPASVEANVFIVHGHSEASKAAVARFVSDITGRMPVILHEQPNGGRTIIEKFEDYAASTAFAIVLLTGDDVGRPAGSDVEHRRARQNVIFEMGFFIGALERSRVAVLYEPGVEPPSDISGVLYTVLDPGGAWRMDIAREMRAAGQGVNLNRAIE